MRAAVSEYLELLKKEIDAYSERDVVYFIVTRTRMRIARTPRYVLINIPGNCLFYIQK
jgi:hypothetical protein